MHIYQTPLKSGMRMKLFLVLLFICESVADTCDICINAEGQGLVNKALTLKCLINSFNSGWASWIKNENETMSECLNNGFCTSTILQNKNFTSDEHGTYLAFRPLEKEDIGVTWQCFYHQNKASYTVADRTAPANQGISNLHNEHIVLKTMGCLVLMALPRLLSRL